MSAETQKQTETNTAGQSALIEPLGGYVAMCKVTTQINEDEWKTYTACKVLSAENTVKDIIAWYRKYHKYGFNIEIVEAT